MATRVLALLRWLLVVMLVGIMVGLVVGITHPAPGDPPRWVSALIFAFDGAALVVNLAGGTWRWPNGD